MFPDYLKETDSFSIERVIIQSILGPRCKVIKTKAGKKIRAIRKGKQFTFEGNPIKYIQKDDLFVLEPNNQEYDPGTLFLEIIKSKDSVFKSE